MSEEYGKKIIKKLEKKIRDLEIENNLVNQELRSLRLEIDRLREPPLVGAVVVDTLEEDGNKVVVAGSTGPFFVVNLSKKVKDKKIEAGTVVALNQRTFAVMDVLPITCEQIKNAKELIFLTELTLKKDND
jgi:proteasome regulatory subunit